MTHVHMYTYEYYTYIHNFRKPEPLIEIVEMGYVNVIVTVT